MSVLGLGSKKKCGLGFDLVLAGVPFGGGGRVCTSAGSGGCSAFCRFLPGSVQSVVVVQRGREPPTFGGTLGEGFGAAMLCPWVGASRGPASVARLGPP